MIYLKTASDDPANNYKLIISRTHTTFANTHLIARSVVLQVTRLEGEGYFYKQHLQDASYSSVRECINKIRKKWPIRIVEVLPPTISPNVEQHGPTHYAAIGAFFFMCELLMVDATNRFIVDVSHHIMDLDEFIQVATTHPYNQFSTSIRYQYVDVGTVGSTWNDWVVARLTHSEWF